MQPSLDSWRRSQLDRLQKSPLLGYHENESLAAEPIAIGALVAIANDFQGSSQIACDALASAQLSDGAVSVYLNDDGPFWTTALACIAWNKYSTCYKDEAANRYKIACDRGIRFLLACGGEVIPRNKIVGHNSELVGWPWVLGTHSWLEPTALALMALRHAGYQSHARASEAAELLLDRQLTDGGANYGNTMVLGQPLRPHVLPSAMSVVALANLFPLSRRLEPTIGYLQRELNRPLGATSLAWTVLALVSANAQADTSLLEFHWPIGEVIKRSERVPAPSHHNNLILLAMLGDRSPLLDAPVWELVFDRPRSAT